MSLDKVLPMSLDYFVTYVPERYILKKVRYRFAALNCLWEQSSSTTRECE
jgi:hypothetical protein